MHGLYILSQLIPSQELNRSKDTFVKRIYPAMKERGEGVRAMDGTLGRNWSKPYYLYHLYAALANYTPPELARILEGLGDLHAASRQGLDPEDMLAATVTLLAGGKGGRIHAG